jgi:succinyl-CoA synthetase alpha subunit
MPQAVADLHQPKNKKAIPLHGMAFLMLKPNGIPFFEGFSYICIRRSFKNPPSMSVLVHKDSKILVQGFTGTEGTFHASQMIEYGTNLVGGVTPGKGGTTHLEKPVFNTVSDAVKETGADVSIIFVPPAFAADAICEAADAGIALVVCITEGIPVQDMVKVKNYLADKPTRLVGPNCPGVITADEAKVGIMPGFIFKKGHIGIVSKSGTLTYEAADQIVKAGMGITTAIGIGGDPIIGTTTREAVELLMNDPETHGIVMIGEIGGGMEAEAAYWIRENNRKPVVGFIAGQTAPPGRRMGHAGAIIGGSDDTAEAKMRIMRECGIMVADSPADIGKTMVEAMKK